MSEPLTEPAPEPDEPDSEPAEPTPDGDEPESQTSDAPEQVEAYARMEQIGGQLDKLNKHVAKRIGEILGDLAPHYVPCELCGATSTPGWRLGEGIPEHVAAEVMHAIGERAPSDFQADPHSQACSGCNGLGEVVTGSKVRGQETLPCLACQGKGWKATGPERGGFGNVVLPTAATASNGPAQSEPPVLPTPRQLPPEAEALRLAGYTIIAPSH